MSKAQGLWCGIWWSVYTLIHFPILAFMACSGDCESASEYYEALHEGVFLKLLFCHHLLNLTSVQTCIVFVEHEDCRQRMFMMLCFIQWKWMGMDHYRASNMMYCMSILKVCISNLYIFLWRTDRNLVCTIAILHQLQDMWQLHS